MNAIDRLAELRPTDEALEALWSSADRTATLDEVLGGPRLIRARAFAPSRRRHRTVAFGMSAAAVTAVAIAVPVAVIGAGRSHTPSRVTDHSAPPATSATATSTPAPALTTAVTLAPVDSMKPGQYLHVVEVEKQDGQWPTSLQCPSSHQSADPNDPSCPGGWVPDTQPPVHYRAAHESWTASDGTTWRVDREISNVSATNGRTSYYKFPPSFGAYPYSPKKFADLPTDPAALEQVLRDYNSKHYAGESAEFLNYEIFDAVHGMLSTRVASPKLRLAAVQVLERAPGVTRGPATTDSLGRAALEFVATNTKTGSSESLFLDPNTLEIEQESSTRPVSVIEPDVYESVDVADAVPADVLQKAVLQSN
jgi:hypothetical protein